MADELIPLSDLECPAYTEGIGYFRGQRWWCERSRDHEGLHGCRDWESPNAPGTVLAIWWKDGGERVDMEHCARCNHPQSWHRHDDADNTPPDDPACKFRCLGYDCMAAGKPPPGGRACDCPDFTSVAPTTGGG